MGKTLLTRKGFFGAITATIASFIALFVTVESADGKRCPSGYHKVRGVCVPITPTATAPAASPESPTETPTAPSSSLPSSTPTPSSSSASPTPSPSPTSTSTPSPTSTATETPTATSTPSPTATSTATSTATETPSSTPVSSPTPTSTRSSSPPETNTPLPGETKTPTSTPTASAEASAWEDLGPVPQIAGSPTALARIICQLHPHNGRIFLGYGDFNDIVQPGCDIIAYNPTSKQLESYGHFATDAFWSLRTVNGEMWAPITDPEVGTNPDIVIVANDGSVRVWQDAWPNPWHLFDAVSFNGQQYCCGSISIDGSTDAQGVWGTYQTSTGLTRWRVVYQGGAGRIYALFVLGSTLYAAGEGGTFKTADGINWLSAPGAGAYRPFKPLSYGGAVVYRAAYPALNVNFLYSYNGVRATSLGTVQDHFVEAGALWTLDDTRMVRRDGSAVIQAPVTAMSLCVMDSHIYVGTRDSHILTTTV